MQVKYKILFICILFFGIIILGNTNSFASTYKSMNGERKSFPEFPLEIADNEAAIIYKNTSDNYIFMLSYRLRHSRGTYDHAEYFPYILAQNSSNSTYTIRCYYPIYYYTLVDDEWKYGGWYNQTKSFANITDFFYSSYDLVYNSTGAIIFPATEENDNVPLFTLNLTDKDNNNKKHEFILSVSQSNTYYDELMEYYREGYNYAIYMTDYTRLKVFETDHLDSPIVGSSYLLSGYIDFITTDSAYFYYSPYYGRIRINSGQYYDNTVSTSVKRFFYTLVFSEDSDDTYFTIRSDNGCLWALSDYMNIVSNYNPSSAITDVKNTYFIGSNQTIFFANEDQYHIFSSLSPAIYYIGCNDAKFTKYLPVSAEKRSKNAWYGQTYI